MTTASGTTIFLDIDSDEETPPKQKYGSTRRRGQGRNTSQTKSSKYVDSPPKERCNTGSKRRRGRGRGKLQTTTTTTKSSKQFNRTSVVIDEDDSLIIQGESFSPTHPLSDEELHNSIIEESNINNNDTGLSRISEAADVVLVTENCAPAVSQPRKTTRRGLAKKHCEPPPNSDSCTLPLHKVSVYSQAVAEEFKSLLHGVSSAATEADVDDSVEHISTESKESCTELSSTNMDCNLMESQENFRKQDKDEVEVEADEKMIAAIQILSPSPPARVFTKRARPMNRKLTSALKALNQAKISLDKQPTPSKFQRRDSDVIIVGEETCIKDIIVKVRYLTNVHRIQMKLNDPFHVLTRKLGKEINEAEHNLGLFLHDRSLEVTKTPQSVSLSVADIIECHCIKISEDSVCSSDAVELVIQCRNNKSKTTIIANRRRPLGDVIQKYAQLMNVAAHSLIFSFDGEDVEPSDTPSKLEMEDHDVIDVVHT